MSCDNLEVGVCSTVMKQRKDKTTVSGGKTVKDMLAQPAVKSKTVLIKQQKCN